VPEKKKRRKTVTDAFLSKKMDPAGHTPTTLQKVALLTKKMDKSSSAPLGESSSAPWDEASGMPYGVPIGQSVPTPNAISYGTPDATLDELPIVLNENQFILYYICKQLTGKITTTTLINIETGIPVNTLKANLKRLRYFNVIDHRGRQHAGAGKFGFTTKILKENIVLTGDENKATRILKGVNYDNLILNKHPRVHLTAHPICNSSSSSFPEKTTTSEIENTLSSHPELGYWRHKGLTEKQMSEWIKITGNLENLIQSLCYCRFDMVDLDQEQSKPIKNIFNWFFKIIEKAGAYPKPKGYKSFEDKQIEQERAALKEKEKRIEELRSLSRKKWELEREESFWEMMSDPAGNLYKECHGTLNNFAKKSKGRVLESSMRAEFDKIMDERDKGS
jgi:hypothetical protein